MKGDKRGTKENSDKKTNCQEETSESGYKIGQYETHCSYPCKEVTRERVWADPKRARYPIRVGRSLFVVREQAWAGASCSSVPGRLRCPRAALDGQK